MTNATLGIDLTTQTKAQLTDLAAQLDIKVKASWTKAKMIETIEANLDQAPVDEDHDEIDEDDDETPFRLIQIDSDEYQAAIERAISAKTEIASTVDLTPVTTVETEDDGLVSEEVYLSITAAIKVYRKTTEISEIERASRIAQLMAWKEETLEDKALQKKIRQALRDLNNFRYLGAYYRHNPLAPELAAAIAGELAMTRAMNA